MAKPQTAPHLSQQGNSGPSTPPPSFSPEQLEAIRQKAIEAGIQLGSKETFKVLPNKGIKLEITLPPEVAVPLITWAEVAGDDPHIYIEREVVNAVTALVYAGYGATD